CTELQSDNSRHLEIDAPGVASSCFYWFYCLGTGFALYKTVANNSPCSLLRAAMRLPPLRGAFFRPVIGGETGGRPRGIEAPQPGSHSGHGDVRGAQADHTKGPRPRQTKRIPRMADRYSRAAVLAERPACQGLHRRPLGVPRPADEVVGLGRRELHTK